MCLDVIDDRRPLRWRLTAHGNSRAQRASIT